MVEFTANMNEKNFTLIKVLEKAFRDVPHSAIRKAIRNKDIKINGKRINDPKYKINVGDAIVVYGLESVRKDFDEASKNFDIVFEDKNILVVNKKSGDVMHDDKKSLDNQVKTYLKATGFNFKQATFIPSHCHRLDKLTSGLVIYAKTHEALSEINKAFKERNAVKKYQLVIQGRVEIDQTINGYINYINGHGKFSEQEFEYAKECSTTFKTIRADGHATLLEAQLHTGRKHQIRIVISHMGYPIIGDKKYGSKMDSRLMLNSCELSFSNLGGNLQYLNGKIFDRRLN